jgi:hypothetical protein
MSADDDVSVLRGRSDFKALLESIRPKEVAPPRKAKP